MKAEEAIKHFKLMVGIDVYDDYFQDVCRTAIEALEKVENYKDLEEQGLLLRLPCKIGDTAYWIDDYEIYSDKVNEFEIRKENGEYIFCIAWMDFKADDFGKKVFFSREEAEQKLKEMEDNA